MGRTKYLCRIRYFECATQSPSRHIHRQPQTFPPYFKRRSTSCLSVVCMQVQWLTCTFEICVAIVNCYLDCGGCSYVLLEIWMPGCDFAVHVRNRPKTVRPEKKKKPRAISGNIAKAIIMMVVRTGTMKINFFTRTLRPLLVEQAPSEANDCSLLANVELVYVRETHSLHPSRRLTNRSNPC